MAQIIGIKGTKWQKSASKMHFGADKNFLKKFKKIFKKVLTNEKRCDIIMTVAERATWFGSIAQLGEHLPYKQRVVGSSPAVPTIRPGSSVG